MNKILISFSILIGSILTAMNINGQGDLIFSYGNGAQLTIFAIFIGILLGFGIKGFLIEKKSGNSYNNNDEGVNF